jgi:hypothetical protein
LARPGLPETDPNPLKYGEPRRLDKYYVLPPLMLAAATYLLGLFLGRHYPGSGASGRGISSMVWPVESTAR